MAEANNQIKQSNAAKFFKDFTRAIIAVPKSEIDEAAMKLPPQIVKPQRIEKPESK